MKVGNDSRGQDLFAMILFGVFSDNGLLLEHLTKEPRDKIAKEN